MTRRAIIIGALAVGAALLAWWAIADPSASVRDVREAETLVLGAETGRPAYAISIRGSGGIDGEATISLLVGGEPYQVETLRGPVNFRWDGDWYAETAEVRYEPANVRAGKVVLHYHVSKL